jgi:hypothetical protein
MVVIQDRQSLGKIDKWESDSAWELTSSEPRTTNSSTRPEEEDIPPYLFQTWLQIMLMLAGQTGLSIVLQELPFEEPPVSSSIDGRRTV